MLQRQAGRHVFCRLPEAGAYVPEELTGVPGRQLEQSNVNIVTELVGMINARRASEANQKAEGC